MKGQDNRNFNTGTKGLKSKEGEQQRLSCNSASICSPSLDININDALVTDKMLIDQLAKILVDIFLERKRNEYKQQKESGNLLQGINKRTS